jgi:hypothetical protein
MCTGQIHRLSGLFLHGLSCLVCVCLQIGSLMCVLTGVAVVDLWSRGGRRPLPFRFTRCSHKAAPGKVIRAACRSTSVLCLPLVGVPVSVLFVAG